MRTGTNLKFVCAESVTHLHEEAIWYNISTCKPSI